MPGSRKPIRLFISYSRRDQELRDELDRQLSPLKRREFIDIWHDRHIDAGKEWDHEIKRNLEEADIIVLLVSADFMYSDYAWTQEMERALERHEAGEARVIPVILHPCDWELAPFAKIQALPRNARPVSTWPNRAEALADIARGVRIVAQDIAKHPLKRPTAPTPNQPEVAPRVQKRQRKTEPAHLEPRPKEAVSATPRSSAPESASPAPQEAKTRANPIDGQTYIWIPPGEFPMGCSEGDEECWGAEKPRHEVRITRGFWMGRTPVTVGAYRKFVEATKRKAPEKPDFEETDEHPVVNVSWEEAKAYCEWAGGRLPTEAEWEYAARAGTTSARYGELDEIAWYTNNTNDTGSRPVGGMQANGFGLYDTLGNVWEWCADWFDEKYYEVSPKEDPKGPEKGGYRVVRGGSWFSNPRLVRASVRNRYRPGGRFYYIGFRCVRDQIS